MYATKRCFTYLHVLELLPFPETWRVLCAPGPAQGHSAAQAMEQQQQVRGWGTRSRQCVAALLRFPETWRALRAPG